MALSEVAENDSRQNRNEKARHKINTKNINNSTIVSDNLEKSNHTGALLFPFPPSNSSSFLKWIKNSKNGGRCCSETISEAGEGLIFSQSHVLVLIDFLINHLILRHQHLSFISFEVLIHHPPSTSSYYKSLLQTWQRLTLERSWPPFRVSCPGE